MASASALSPEEREFAVKAVCKQYKARFSLPQPPAPVGLDHCYVNMEGTLKLNFNVAPGTKTEDQPAYRALVRIKRES